MGAGDAFAAGLIIGFQAWPPGALSDDPGNLDVCLTVGYYLRWTPQIPGTVFVTFGGLACALAVGQQTASATMFAAAEIGSGERLQELLRALAGLALGL